MKKTIEDRKKFLDVSPDTTVDVVLLTLKDDKIGFLGTLRPDVESYPFPNSLGMPGVYLSLKEDENELMAAIRALKTKAHLENIPFIEQFQTFCDKDRDPRWFTATIVHIGFVNYEEIKIENEDVFWVFEEDFDKFNWAFDHKEIVKKAISVMRREAAYSAKIINFLPEKFSQPQLQNLYEVVLNEKLDKPSFRKQIVVNDLLEEVEGEMIKGKMGRRAKLYKVSKDFDIMNDFFFPSNLGKRVKKK